MNLDELTRNCFQSGLSAPKWLALCRKFTEKTPTSPSHEVTENSLSNSILVLFSSYPGDTELQGYLKYAIRSGMLSLASYVTTFLQASRSPDLHTVATLDLLCQVALEAHYTSGMAPIGSIVSFAETPVTILNKIQDAMALLRTTYTLPISHFHQVTSSASQLTVLLLSCVSDFSQISNTQAAMHYTDANDLLTTYRLEPEVRQMLETFVISLSISMGDDVKAAREAQMIQSMQLSMGKTDTQGSDSDVITFGLIFHQWESLSSRVLLPSLLASFETAVKGDNSSQGDWRNAVLSALEYIYRRPDLIVKCEHILSRATGNSEDDLGRSFSRDFLYSFIRHELIDLNFALQLDPAFSLESGSRLFGEAQEAGAEFSVYLESKLGLDVEIADACNWVSRIWRDSDTHHTFAHVVFKRYTHFAMSLDADDLSHLCKIMYTSDHALDILVLHVKLTEVVFRALKFLEEYDCGTVGDPQTAVSHLGDVVLLIQYTIIRFGVGTKLNPSHISMMDQSISASYLFSSTNVQDPGTLSPEETSSFTAWFKALFDSSSEGIEDTIIRSTPPKLLLRLSTTLIAQALRLKVETDVLNNGVSYFTSSLLNWTLFNVVRGIIKEFESTKPVNSAFLDILQTFVLSPYCPRPVILLCKDQLYGLTNLKRTKLVSSFDANAVRSKLADVTGRSNADGNKVAAGNSQTWEERSKQDIHDAITAASSQKAPSLNVEKCLRFSSPTRFLRHLWSEIVIPGSMRETETVKRMATFVLATPRSSETPPLLPIFLHVVLPTLISSIDSQLPAEQNVIVDILVTIISSALTAAAHLDWAVRTISGEHKPVLGQHSPAMVRQLAVGLRTQKHTHAGSLVASNLAASQTFVSNFPFFVTELNAELR
ncbi:Mediator of RNA polymerase II transcription subunit 5 [Leucoagaricus sp. SymC.cos]|nr:Mediator of RNA polymerase II transcription subunit 5 [Leucoagaricus sp. SymC.cos]